MDFRALLTIVLVLVAAACVEAPKRPGTGGDASGQTNRPAGIVEPSSAPLPPLPNPLPGARRDLTASVAGALRAAAGDLTGDGKAEIVLADAQALWVIDQAGKTLARHPATAGIHVLAVLDADGNGKREIAAGWGETRDHRGASASIVVYRLEKGRLVEEVVTEPRTPRNEIAAILPVEGGLFLAWFESKYMVKTARAVREAGGWVLSERPAIRMATAYDLGDVDGDKQADLLVARIYGDAKDVDGDAFLQGEGGQRRPIPTTRGARSILAADSDGDGRAEVFVADGWHQNYGKLARGLLTWATFEDGAFKSRPIDDSPGQFTMARLLAGDLDGDGKPEVVAQGSHYVRVYKRKGEAWDGLTVGGATRDLAVVDRGLLLVGDKSELVDLKGALP